jgi:hypothetical protein
VLLICVEDGAADTIRPRLDAQGADARRVHLLATVRRDEGWGRRDESQFSLADPSVLEQALEAQRDCRLVIVDPIGSFLGRDTDSYREGDVRAVLMPVLQLAEAYGVAVLVVAHRRKSKASAADDLTMGSRAFTGVARAVWHVTRDVHNAARRFLVPGKNNLAAGGAGLAFTIAGTPATLRWEPDPVVLTADEAVRQESARADDRSAVAEAAKWLALVLANGPVPAQHIVRRARNDGIGWRTVQRAKERLGIRSGQTARGWHWCWPDPVRGEPEPQPAFAD